jgi:hypothetical protein
MTAGQAGAGGKAKAKAKAKAPARPGPRLVKLGKIGAAVAAAYLVVRHLNPVKLGRLARNAVAVYALAPRPGLAGLRWLGAASVVLFAVIRRRQGPPAAAVPARLETPARREA